MEIMWENEADGFKAVCEYLSKEASFKVTVTYKDKKKEKKFAQTWEPRFGMDVLDQSLSYEIAENLSQEIEKELGLR